jgi:tripartite-type tricarboxylate transporter receptor subunit TctC
MMRLHKKLPLVTAAASRTGQARVELSRPRRITAVTLFLTTLMQLYAASALASDFPSKPINLIVAAGAGGSSDILARRLGQIITAQSSVQVVVENKAGGSGSIGIVAAARAPKDGYTVVISVPDAVTIYPLMKKIRPYDSEKTLTPIAQIAETPFVFAVSTANRASNLAEFVAHVKANPAAPVNFASTGNGTSARLVGEMLVQQAGITMTHVPYRSAAPALLGVASGESHIQATSIASAKALVDGGKLKLIGVTRETRLPGFNIPTAAEGGLPRMVVGLWYGIFAPAGLPKDVQDKLASLFLSALNSEEMKPHLAALGLEPKPRAPAEFTAFLKEDTKVWRDVIRASNIPLED